MLASRHRLRDSADFRAAGRGARAPGKYVVVHLMTTDADSVRAGFVVSKAVGNAVVRNRTKRRLRAIMSDRLTVLPDGATAVIRARPAAATASFAELQAETSSLLTKAVARRRPRRSAADRPTMTAGSGTP